VGVVQAQVPLGKSRYHALQSKVERRFAHGFGLLAAYTFAKSMDNGPAPFNLGRSHQQPQDPLALGQENALSASDQRHNLVTGFLWALPIARSTRGWQHKALGGWQVNGIVTLHSGLPVNVVRNGSLRDYEGLRPNVTGDPNLPDSERTLAHYFDTGVFSTKGLGQKQVGNAGRNIVRGPGFAEADVSLMKEVAVTESGKLELRVEAFNVANRANFASPNSDMSQGSFGSITNTVGIPRIMQFAMKFKF
jgi:hypothetical protein